MSHPIRVLLYGDCPELEYCELNLEVCRIQHSELRNSFKQEIRGFDVAILEARGEDQSSLQYVRFLRQLAPGCATIMVAEPESLPTVKEAINQGLHDYVLRVAGARELAPLLTHTIERALKHNHVKKRFHDSEKRFWTLFDNSDLGIVILGLEKNLEHANPAFQRMLGLTMDELRERSFRELLCKEEVPIFEPLYEELLTAKRDYHRLKLKLHGAEQQLCFAQVHFLAMREPDGSPAYVMGLFLDQTEKKQIQNNLQHADKMQAMGRLAGGMAHDFNNLLTIVDSHCYIMQEALEDKERLNWSLHRIMTATQRGSKLTRQLLTFGRRHKREPENLDPNEMLEDMRVVLESLFGKTIRVELALAQELRAIKADRSQIEQVIMNLALNARDAMEDGGQFSVRTYNLEVRQPNSAIPSELPRGEYTVLEVADTGAGMPAEIQTRVFEAFFTTKPPGQGTGLGLATVQTVILQNEGYITVDSEEGKGTQFQIYFPSSRQKSTTPPKLRRVRQATPFLATETILLVEDEEELREPMKRLLEGKGYHVLEAANAEEALSISREYSGDIDLLLSDVIMPGADGLMLAQMVTTDRPSTRVLLMSGYTADALAINSEGTAKHKLLQKPFGMDILNRTIRQMLKPV